MTVEISSGAPDLAQQAPLPGGVTSGRLVAVSCPSGTACQAVGFANTAAGSVPLVDTAANGAFVTATELPSAPNQTSASSEQEDLLSGIQCTSTGNCVIAGNYENSYLGEQAFVIDESAGTYAPASPVGSSSLATFGVSGVACGSAGACTLVATETPAATQLPEAAQVREVERATATLTTNATGQASYNYNQSISDTATLSGGSASPGGTLVFLVFAPTDSTCSANPVNGANPVTVTGDGNFNAPTTSPTQGPGTYSWVVLYTGDANNNPVLSPCHSPNEESDVHLAMTPESDLQEAYLGEIYPSYVQAYGNSSPFSYSITSGSLPDGLTFAPNTVTAGFAGYPDDPSQAGQTFTFTVAVTDVNGATGSATYSITVAGLPHGYWLVGSDGGIFTFGDAGFYGSTGALTLQRPVVGITPTFDFGGYWLVASDGGIFTFGDGGFYGSIPGLGLQPAGSGKAHSLNAPIVGMVPSIDGGGYFMVAADGGVFAFGDATYAGSCPSIGGCSGAAVAVMPDGSGSGYWLVTRTGHVYTFGDATYYGAPGPGAVPVTSSQSTPDGGGYWILLGNGTVDAFGDAVNYGSPAGQFVGFDPATAIFPTLDGAGYWVASANGTVDSYGDATNEGSMAGKQLNGPIIAASGF